MKGDFSRLTFNPKKHHSGVLFQQGKVQLDADLNELQAIQQYHDAVEARDIIGWSGAPKTGGGFKIGVTADKKDLTISSGRIYVDGHLCRAEATHSYISGDLKIFDNKLKILPNQVLEGRLFKVGQRIEIFFKDNSSKVVKIASVKKTEITFEPSLEHSELSLIPAGSIRAVRWAYTYFHQPYFVPGPLPDISEEAENSGEKYLVYLDVWERYITAIDDPEIREKALGGVETAGRSKTVWQVKLLPVGEGAECSDFGPGWNPSAKPRGLLNVRTALVPEGTNDCLLPSQAGYRGLENRLYRVEIHKGGHFGNGDKVSFKWSRDNGSVVAPVKKIDGVTITVDGVGPDSVSGFATGQWAELLNDLNEFHRIPGQLSAITIDESSNTVTFAPNPPNTIDLANRHAKLRRWDCSGEQEVKIPQENDGWIELENEVEIKFSEGHYTTGDYWIIPARSGIQSETGTIDWPYDDSANPLPQPPQGVSHHYAPLAIVERNSDGQFKQFPLSDCRNPFLPLIDLAGTETGCKTHCCTMTVGDGVTSHGDFNDLQEAVENMPEKGGKICVLPGIHHANASVIDREDIHIKGCGSQSIVHPCEDKPKEPILSFSSCRNIKIEDLTLVTFDGTAVEVDDTDNEKPTTGFLIEQNQIFALTHAIDIRVPNLKAGNNHIRIRKNEIGIWDIEGGDVAIFSNADDVVIEDNRILVIPSVNSNDPTDPRDPGGPEFSFFDPCEDRSILYRLRPRMLQVVKATIAYIKTSMISKIQSISEYKAKGGIQIGGGSEMVRVSHNQIIGGYGNGITLGHLPVKGELGVYFQDKIMISNLESAHLEYLDRNFLGYLYEIVIENNYIAGMGLSGIGVAAFMHTESIGLMVSVDEVTIRENHITKCANQVPDEKPESMLREVGFGGIVLAACENVVIAHNKIQDNGRYENQAVCGVLIVYGEDVDVSNNRIINNGPLGQVNGRALDRGLRGGIVVLISFKQLVFRFRQNKGFTRPDGIPAVKVHDNVVVQPMGRALFLIAFGPVSVVSNQFTSQGADHKTNPLSAVAGAVLIVNLGVSQDLMAAMFLKSFRNIASANPKAFTESQAPVQVPDAAAALRFLYLPSGNVMYTGNQTTLDLQDEVIELALSAQAIVSLDDVAYNSNQSEVRSLFDQLVTDVALIGATVRANDNRFQEGFTATLNSLMAVGFMAMAASNQATHCIQLFGPAEFSTLLGNSILYQMGPCAKYGIIIGTYIGVKPIAQ